MKNPGKNKPKTHPSNPAQLKPSSILLIALALLAISLALNLAATGWGQPGGYTWHPDSVAGKKSLALSSRVFSAWKYKYPRLHFLINAAVYKPFVNHWEKNPVTITPPPPAKPKLVVITTARLSKLIVASQVISALMGAAAVLAVFLAARLLFNDDLAALFAALALATSMLFVLYCHLGNLDIPTTFWFTWAVYWAVKAMYVGRWQHFILTGAFAAFAVCTKDPTAGYVVGLALALFIAFTANSRQEGLSLKKAVLSVFNKKTLAAIIAALFFFALLNDLLTSTDAFFDRMSHWIGGSGTTHYQKRFAGHWLLLVKTCKNFHYSLGSPLLAMTAVSIIYCIVKYTLKAVFCLIPLVAFYLIVITYTHFSYPRFFLPALPLLAFLVGKTIADFTKSPKIPKIIKILIPVFIYSASLLYCIGIDMEMANDSRYRAEDWLRKNVETNEVIIALAGANYSPRLHQLNYRYGFIEKRPKNEQMISKIRPYADYLVLSQKEYQISSAFDRQFLEKLLSGSMGYHRVATFSNLYHYPRKTIFGFAGWPRKIHSVVSPTIIILRKNGDSK